MLWYYNRWTTKFNFYICNYVVMGIFIRIFKYDLNQSISYHCNNREVQPCLNKTGTGTGLSEILGESNELISLYSNHGAVLEQEALQAGEQVLRWQYIYSKICAGQSARAESP